MMTEKCDCCGRYGVLEQRQVIRYKALSKELRKRVMADFNLIRICLRCDRYWEKEFESKIKYLLKTRGEDFFNKIVDLAKDFNPEYQTRLLNLKPLLTFKK